MKFLCMRVIESSEEFQALVAGGQSFCAMFTPSFLTFSKGEVTGSFISRLRKTRQQIVDFLGESYSKI